MAFILKYLTVRCLCQLKVAARKKKKSTGQNQLPAKISHQNGCQPIKRKIKMAAIVKEKMYTSQKWLPAKINYQPNAGGSLNLLSAKE